MILGADVGCATVCAFGGHFSSWLDTNVGQIGSIDLTTAHPDFFVKGIAVNDRTDKNIVTKLSIG